MFKDYSTKIIETIDHDLYKIEIIDDDFIEIFPIVIPFLDNFLYPYAKAIYKCYSEKQLDIPRNMVLFINKFYEKHMGWALTKEEILIEANAKLDYKLDPYILKIKELLLFS